MIKYVLKRDNSTIVEYDSSKIRRAILSANKEVEDKYKITNDNISKIIEKLAYTYSEMNDATLNIEEIQEFVEDELMKMGYIKLAKKYITYRYKRELIRKANTTDESILGLIRNSNKDVMEENSNKKAILNSTKRDLIAGEVSKDITNRLLLPQHITKAHQRGEIHFHDADYFLMPEFNCCLPNFKDMLENGTRIHGIKIKTPKSFRVACNQVTQIMADISSNQYGGQTFYADTLGKYLAYTREKFLKRITENINKVTPDLDDDTKNAIINSLLEEELDIELKAGIQCIQYQINTLMTTNGQSPFVTIFMYLREDDPYIEENAKIIEEILKQRLQGIEIEDGKFATPSFPKLIYVLDENNCLKGGKYDYLTRLALKCSAKRMYPDYISAKVMRENYNGEVFGCMGCRSFLSEWIDPETGLPKWEGRFNQGVVTLNLPMIALDSAGDFDKFWEIMEERLALCHEALMCRHKALEGTISDVSPIHWQDGGLARLKPGETIDELLHGGYSTISLGYIGLYECVKFMTGHSHTDNDGRDFSLRVMKRLRDATEAWKAASGIAFGLYGTPAESTCYTLCSKIRKEYGEVENITDKDWLTNSYHVDVREPIDIFTKFDFESIYQKISSGGAISYGEIPDLTDNVEALEDVVKYVYEHIQYAEVNGRSGDHCLKCDFEGEMAYDNDNNKWYCPECGCDEPGYLKISRRTCGYLGEDVWNYGKTKEIQSRVLHLH